MIDLKLCFIALDSYNIIHLTALISAGGNTTCQKHACVRLIRYKWCSKHFWTDRHSLLLQFYNESILSFFTYYEMLMDMVKLQTFQFMFTHSSENNLTLFISKTLIWFLLKLYITSCLVNIILYLCSNYASILIWIVLLLFQRLTSCLFSDNSLPEPMQLFSYKCPHDNYRVLPPKEMYRKASPAKRSLYSSGIDLFMASPQLNPL